MEQHFVIRRDDDAGQAITILRTQRETLLDAIKDLLQAIEMGWVDRTYPDGTTGKRWGAEAVDRAREAVADAEGRRQTVLIIENEP